jgi:hypothetical protein
LETREDGLVDETPAMVVMEATDCTSGLWEATAAGAGRELSAGSAAAISAAAAADAGAARDWKATSFTLVLSLLPVLSLL